MKQIAQYQDGRIELQELAIPTAPAGGILVRTTHSVISIGTEKMKVTQAKMNLLQKARARQNSAEWKADYKATRPKVERKFGHLMRRKHGGRRCRVRGRTRVAQDFSLLAAAVNLARLAAIGLMLCSAAT